MILTTNDVCKQGVAREISSCVVLGDETDRNTGNRTLERHACIKEGEYTGAD